METKDFYDIFQNQRYYTDEDIKDSDIFKFFLELQKLRNNRDKQKETEYFEDLKGRVIKPFIEIQIYNSIRKKKGIIETFFDVKNTDIIKKFSSKLYDYFISKSFVFPDDCGDNEITFYYEFIDSIKFDIEERTKDKEKNKYSQFIDEFKPVFFKVVYKIIKLDKFYNIGLNSYVE